jgi:hypothetical protein
MTHNDSLRNGTRPTCERDSLGKSRQRTNAEGVKQVSPRHRPGNVWTIIFFLKALKGRNNLNRWFVSPLQGLWSFMRREFPGRLPRADMFDAFGVSDNRCSVTTSRVSQA